MDLNKNMKIKSFSRRKEKFRKRLFPITIITIIIIGMLYQQLSIHFTASHLGRMGRLVDVDGVNMHLYESTHGGLSSEIPIVFTANIASSSPYVDLYPVHHVLSENYQVLVYDKPGYGWSDTTSKSRDIDTICEEIHTVLHSNDNPDDEDERLKPFIYVAQGMGSLEAIRYAQLYPEDVAGLVFIDGTSPQFCEDYNNIMIIESFMINALRNIGVLRLLSHTDFVKNTVNDNPELSDTLRHINKGLGLNNTWNRNVISEKLKLSDNATKIITDMGENKLGDLPIRVITSQANTLTNWSRCQRQLLALSSDASQEIISDSTTYVHQSDVPTITTTIENLVAHIEELRDN